MYIYCNILTAQKFWLKIVPLIYIGLVLGELWCKLSLSFEKKLSMWLINTAMVESWPMFPQHTPFIKSAPLY